MGYDSIAAAREAIAQEAQQAANEGYELETGNGSAGKAFNDPELFSEDTNGDLGWMATFRGGSGAVGGGIITIDKDYSHENPDAYTHDDEYDPA